VQDINYVEWWRKLRTLTSLRHGSHAVNVSVPNFPILIYGELRPCTEKWFSCWIWFCKNNPYQWTSPLLLILSESIYTLSEAWGGVNWADLMAARGDFGTDFYDKSIILLLKHRLKHRAYYRSGRPVIKIGPKGALGSPIQSAPSLGQSIPTIIFEFFSYIRKHE